MNFNPDVLLFIQVNITQHELNSFRVDFIVKGKVANEKSIQKNILKEHKLFEEFDISHENEFYL